MLVILKESIDNLGRIGDLVKVSDGYARNFLLPRGLVIVADEKNKVAIEHSKKLFEKKRLADKAGADDLSKKLAEHSCTIKRKVGENDKIFGSVTAADIADELHKAGYTAVEKRQVHVGDPIKTLGVHTVSVKLQPEVTAQLKVWVVKEE